MNKFPLSLNTFDVEVASTLNTMSAQAWFNGYNSYHDRKEQCRCSMLDTWLAYFFMGNNREEDKLFPSDWKDGFNFAQQEALSNERKAQRVIKYDRRLKESSTVWGFVFRTTCFLQSMWKRVSDYVQHLQGGSL